MLGKLGEQGEPGFLSRLVGAQQAPLAREPGQESVPNQSTAQSAWSGGSAHAAGKVKPRMELIFPFRNNFSCPKLVWKLLTLGKKGNSSQARALLHFHQELQRFGFMSSFPQACCW